MSQSCRGAEYPANLSRLLIESVVDYAIYVLDSHGHVRSWSPGAERIKGYTAEEILGSLEFRMELVQRFYQTFLHRLGQSSEVGFWTDLLQAGQRDTEIRAGFVSSQEYAAQTMQPL